MFRTKGHTTTKKTEDVKKSAGKVLDTKKDTPTRAKHLRLFLDNSDLSDIVQFFDSYYSHVYFIIYDSFVNAEQSLRQKGAHKAQREELESVLYLLEKVLIFLPEALSQRWQYHSIGRLMSTSTSWKLLEITEKRGHETLPTLVFCLRGTGRGPGTCNICNPCTRLSISLSQHGPDCSGIPVS